MDCGRLNQSHIHASSCYGPKLASKLNFEFENEHLLACYGAEAKVGHSFCLKVCQILISKHMAGWVHLPTISMPISTLQPQYTRKENMKDGEGVIWTRK